jgi:hypothetical protein
MGGVEQEILALTFFALIFFPFSYGIGTFQDWQKRVDGGEGGIRTPDTRKGMPDFESGAFNRALPPLRIYFRI